MDESGFYYESSIQPKLLCMNMPRPTDSYNYPIYPGTKEWADLKTGQEMLDACQIPVTILKKMTTQAVIQAIWEHPLLLEVLNRYQYQMDFESIFFQNNAYKELSERTDAGVSLLNRLELCDYLIPNAEKEPKVLEILMSQTLFLSQLNQDELKTLIEITLKNDELRQEDASLTNDSFRATAWLLIGRILFVAGYEPIIAEMENNEQIRLFLWSDTYCYLDAVYGNIPQIIIDYARNYKS
jgi:hypothetical protein